MNELTAYSCCSNPLCSDFGKYNLGNISFRAFYGKNHDKELLYCKTCGKRFAATRGSPLFGAHLTAEQVHQIIHHAAEGVGVRASARLLGLSTNTINQAIVRVGEHCKIVYRSLMQDLQMNEVQLDELWTFVKKKQLLMRSNLSKDKEKSGSGRP